MAGLITDSVNQRMILFAGGNNRLPWGQYFNDIWFLDFNSETWRLLQLSGNQPPPRTQPAMVFIPSRNQMITFGGRMENICYNDVWVLNLNPGAESWIQIIPSGTPPMPRDAHSAIFDPINNRIIIFGGGDANFIPFNDTWSLNLNDTSWTLLSPSGSLPPPRGAHIAIYDPIQHQMIIFGGVGGSTFYNDVWALDLTLGYESWHQVFPSGTLPDMRGRHWGVYDSENRDVVIGFGFNSSGLYYNDVWALNLNTIAWRQILPSGVSIEGRRGSCAAYDPFHHQIFVFGGDQYYDYYFGDTYVLTLDTLAINENKGNIVIQPYIKVTPNPIEFPCRVNAFVPLCRNQVSLKIYDNTGRIVKTLIENGKSSGNYIIEWDGKDESGRMVSSGTYFIHLNIDGQVESSKAVLLK